MVNSLISGSSFNTFLPKFCFVMCLYHKGAIAEWLECLTEVLKIVGLSPAQTID